MLKLEDELSQGPKTEATAAVSAFDDQFPEAVVKGEQ